MTSQRVGMYEVKRPTAARPARVVFVLRWTSPGGRRCSEVIGERPQMTMIHRAGSTTSTTGSVSRFYGVVSAFDYK